jgi:hypothetical protein
MKPSDDLIFWLRRELDEMRSSIAAMESGQMQVRRLNGPDWIDTTASVKPDLRERMWQLEKLLKTMAADRSGGNDRARLPK